MNFIIDSLIALTSNIIELISFLHQFYSNHQQGLHASMILGGAAGVFLGPPPLKKLFVSVVAIGALLEYSRNVAQSNNANTHNLAEQQINLLKRNLGERETEIHELNSRIRQISAENCREADSCRERISRLEEEAQEHRVAIAYLRQTNQDLELNQADSSSSAASSSSSSSAASSSNSGGISFFNGASSSYADSEPDYSSCDDFFQQEHQFQ